MKEVLISLFSGVIGVILTIGYQHFFSPEQSFTFIFDGKEKMVTKSEYLELVEQNKSLNDELSNLHGPKIERIPKAVFGLGFILTII